MTNAQNLCVLFLTQEVASALQLLSVTLPQVVSVLPWSILSAVFCHHREVFLKRIHWVVWNCRFSAVLFYQGSSNSDADLKRPTPMEGIPSNIKAVKTESQQEYKGKRQSKAIWASTKKKKRTDTGWLKFVVGVTWRSGEKETRDFAEASGKYDVGCKCPAQAARRISQTYRLRICVSFHSLLHNKQKNNGFYSILWRTFVPQFLQLFHHTIPFPCIGSMAEQLTPISFSCEPETCPTIKGSDLIVRKPGFVNIWKTVFVTEHETSRFCGIWFSSQHHFASRKILNNDQPVTKKWVEHLQKRTTVNCCSWAGNESSLVNHGSELKLVQSVLNKKLEDNRSVLSCSPRLVYEHDQ